jgi:hypothetical protein
MKNIYRHLGLPGSHRTTFRAQLRPDFDYEFQNDDQVNEWKQKLVGTIVGVMNDHFEGAIHNTDDPKVAEMISAFQRLNKLNLRENPALLRKALNKLHKLWTRHSALREELTSPRRILELNPSGYIGYCPIQDSGKVIYLLDSIERLKEEKNRPTKEDQLHLVRSSGRQQLKIELEDTTATLYEPHSRERVNKTLHQMDAIAMFIALEHLALPPLPLREGEKRNNDDLAANILSERSFSARKRIFRLIKFP